MLPSPSLPEEEDRRAVLSVITAVGTEAGYGTFGRILVHSYKDANQLS